MSLVPDERTAIKVGGAALALALAAVVFVVAIAPRLAWSKVVRVRVYYTELAGLKEGAPVRSAGETIGRVESIALSPAGQPGPLSGQTGAVVHLTLDPDRLDRTWRGGLYVIGSSGPLAARYLEILPPPPGRTEEPTEEPAEQPTEEPAEPYRPLAEGAELRGIDPPTLDRVLQRTWTNLSIARGFLEEVSPEARQLRGELTRLAQTVRELRAGGPPGSPSASRPEDVLDELSARLEQLLAAAAVTWNDGVGGRDGLARLQALAGGAAATWRNASASAAQLGSLLAQLRAELARLELQLGTAAPGARIVALIEQARGLSARLELVEGSVRVLQQRWQRREGTLGRLLSDPEFPEDAKELGKILKRQPWRLFGHPDDTR